MMNSLNSFKGYGKVDPADQRANLQTKKKFKKRVIIIGVASLVLIAFVICIAVGVSRARRNNDDDDDDSTGELNTSNKAIQAVCSKTLYPSTCVSSLSDYPGAAQAGPKDLVSIAVIVARNELNKVRLFVSDLVNRTKTGPQSIALEDCSELVSCTEAELESTLAELKSFDLKSLTRAAGDVQTWLSATITYQDTCLDGLAQTFNTSRITVPLRDSLQNLTQLLSNSLAIVNSISSLLDDLKIPSINRRLLSVSNSRPDSHSELYSPHGSLQDGFPSWLSAGDRRLLQSSQPKIMANVTVAADGTGQFRTIQAAINAAPRKSKTRYIIYVKKGTYKENVQIGYNTTNIMLVGDGMEATIITGSRNVVDGTTTFRSATVAAVGTGFIAQDLAFVNTAGAIKHQAVALRVGADQSVIYRCKIAAYQDTLYAHARRQFYGNCVVSGTIDFIFGNAAVVFQNCTLLARKPMQYQQNTYTAQGRKDPGQNTGISIQRCIISADSDLYPVRNETANYLGRPWKLYSRTVIMESFLDDLINPAGWLPWNATFALSTLYYGEYMNSGPGSSTANRVKWPGYRVITDARVASKFTVGAFLEDAPWLGSTGFSYNEGL